MNRVTTRLPVISDTEYIDSLKAQKETIAEDLLAACRTGTKSTYRTGDAKIYKVICKYHVEREPGPDETPSATTEYVYDIFDELVAEGRIITKITDKGPAYRVAFQDELKQAERDRLHQNAGLLAGMDMEARRRHFMENHNPRP